MSILELPVTTDPAQEFVTQLGDQKIGFFIKWNDRSQRFELDLYYDTTQEYFARGLSLVLGADLFEPYNYGLGHLVLVDTSNRNTEADMDNFGTVVKLMWVSADELLNETVSNIPEPYLPA